ncbi:AMP-binding protein [Tumebacillus permanentifrigoris]|uniref:AMP-binding enzyme n=1 Tax=Tumebacillus permanentifrigoris TaxID=378543 RepID=A0A316D6D2_9BACL|nr:AMP-binding protein [Tumebacillus permanentifrigoris]PWK08381.1 AMP-binding enzyme [Tumebacillus permanentifrigoris]
MDNISVTSIEGTVTLVDLLRRRAKDRPQDRVMIGHHSAEEVLGSATYAQLDERARAVGALLQGFKAKGERAVLLYAQGPAYLAALFGCFYSGTVAVPVQPPRDVRHLETVQASVEGSRPTVILTTSLLLNSIRDVLREQSDSELHHVRWIATDAIPIELASKWQDAGVRSDMMAYVYHPTGLVDDPSAHCVRHADLVKNDYIVRGAFGDPEAQTGGAVLLAGQLGFAPATE